LVVRDVERELHRACTRLRELLQESQHYLGLASLPASVNSFNVNLSTGRATRHPTATLSVALFIFLAIPAFCTREKSRDTFHESSKDLPPWLSIVFPSEQEVHETSTWSSAKHFQYPHVAVRFYE
jgi:hypothetical protein